MIRPEELDEGPLYAFTFWQPWAWAMAAGVKPWENRKRRPPAAVLGRPVVIHAGLHYDRDQFPELRRLLPVETPGPGAAVRGAVIGLGRVVEAAEGLALLGRSPWLIGPKGMLFAETVEIEPIHCRGFQGPWTVRGDLLAKIKQALTARVAGGVF